MNETSWNTQKEAKHQQHELQHTFDRFLVVVVVAQVEKNQC